jgi:serine/threonine-protein kinase
MSILGSLRASQLIGRIESIGDVDSPEATKVIEKLRKAGAPAIRRITDSLATADRRDTELMVDLLAELITDKTLSQTTKALSSESQNTVAGVVKALGKGRGFNPNRLVDLLQSNDVPKAPLCEALIGQKDGLDIQRLLSQAHMLESTEKATIFRIVAKAASEKDVPELISRLSGKDIVARAHIIDMLSRFDQPNVHAALESQLGDSNKLIRQAALNAIGKMNARPNIEVLTKLLCDPDIDVQNKAVDIIIRVNHPDTVKNLVTALKDESEYTRRAAVEVLNEIGDARAIKDLLEVLGDDDWWVRARATDALAKIGGPKVVSAVLELINDKDEEIRRAAIEILNSTKDERAVKTLIGATLDSDWWVRERAADALAAIGDTRALPALTKMLQGDARSMPSAIRGIAKLGGSAEVKTLQEMLLRPEREVQIEAITALTRLADANNGMDVRERIAKLVNSPDKTVKMAVANAIKALDERFSPSQIQAAAKAERFTEPDHTMLVDDEQIAEIVRSESEAPAQLDITTLQPGDIIEGRYKFVKKIGKGAFGTVLLVSDEVVEENLILKFLNPNVASDEEMMKRFVHELRYSRKITHKNVIRIYDFLHMGGLYAISMEYFPSHTLGDEVKNEQPVPVETAARFGCDIATGMQVAHQAGIVHRDLKPANILINDEGLLKIVDFGVAAARSSGDTQLTKTGYVIGSPKYMAPEQILGKQVDEKADIYSLGVIMYELLTGVPPYTRGDHMSVMYQHVQGKARPPEEINPTLPPKLVDIVKSCMSVDKNKRYPSMSSLHEAMSEFLPAE